MADFFSMSLCEYYAKARRSPSVFLAYGRGERRLTAEAQRTQRKQEKGGERRRTHHIRDVVAR